MMASNLGLGASANQNANERENFNGSFASYSMSRLGSERSSFGTASGLSKPRLVKVRKHVGSQTVKSIPKTGNRIDAGFNPFRPGSSGLDRVDDDSKTQNSKLFTSDSAQGSGGLNNSGISMKDEIKFGKSEDVAFVFGANQSGSSSSFKSEKSESSGNMGESFLNEMKKLNTGIEAESQDAKCLVFGLNASRKWSSGDKGDFEFGSSCETKANLDGNMVSGLPSEMGKSTIDVESTMLEIPEEMKKLNINTSRRFGGADEAKDINLNSGINDKNTFAFGSSKKTADSFAGYSAATLPDEMKKLNAEGPGNVDDVKNDSDEKIRSKGGNTSLYENRKSTAASFGEATENVLPNEAKKLDNGSGIEGSYDLAGTGYSSSRIFVKKQPGNLGEKKFRDPVVAASTSFSSSSPSSQPVRNDYGVHSMDRTENKNGFSFTSPQEELGAPHGDLRTPNQDASFSSTGNIFGLLNRKLEFSAKKGTAKDLRLKKKKGKLRQIPTVHKWTVHDFASRESSSQENMESPGHYSPMDFSPYLDTAATEQCSREASLTSDESFHLDKNYESSDIKTTVSTDATDEVMIDETECLDINGGGLRFGESKEESCGFSFKKTSDVECPGKEVVPESESDCTKFKSEQAEASSDACVDSVETEALPSSNIEKQGSDCRMQFGFASSLEDSGQSKFTFAASSSSQCYPSVSKHHNKKINQMKVYHESHICTPTNGKAAFSNSSMQFSPLVNTSSCMRDTSIYQSEGENKSQGNKEQEAMHGSTSAVAAAQEACEKWRLRGNQAYANGNLSDAEDYYSCGINCISSNEMSRSSLWALVLCYSNRAATRMSLGRMREALGDCLMAAAIDPDFVKVQVRAANCHLALGEVKDAMQYFKKCLQTRSGECLERKIEIEASDGLQKAQQVAEFMEHSTELLQRGTSHDADNALGIVSEALLISSYSERLLEMKAEALFVLQKYEEVIQLCEQTLDSAEKNFFSTSSNGPSESMDVSVCTKNSHVRIWRWRLIAKSYFYLGRLEEALDLLEKQEQMESITEKSGGKIGSPIPLAATVRELLQHKAAGNDAFQSGRHAEAVEHYTAALSCNIESRPFAAICFCNRAAAHQALGQITDAIADCNLSIALDGNYLKAISRRAVLLEMIRDYAQAAKDLQRLVSLLEMQSDDKVNQSLRGGRSTSTLNDVKQARLRISTMEEQSKKGIPLDMYLILGVETSGTVSDIKKAYRKGALRHHPDKAVQFLARTENGDDGLWKEIVGQVHKDADRLFKMIGEAYAVLSDPTKRSRYDQEEEMRKLEKKGNENSGSRTHSNTHKYPFEKQWQEAWKSYGSSHSRWSETSRSNM